MVLAVSKLVFATLSASLYVTKADDMKYIRGSTMDSIRSSKSPPLKQDEISRYIKDRPPATDLPNTHIEVGRFFVGESDDFKFEYDESTNSFVIEKRFNLEKSVDPDGMKADILDMKQFKDVSDDVDLDGGVPAHLAFKVDPAKIENTFKKVSEGNDIPINVFGADDRYTFRDTSYPWSTTGRVETDGGVCTGTMVGRRLMLTAAHCINWTDEGAGWIKFTPSYYNGDAPFGVAWGTRIIHWGGVDGSDGLSNAETARDYAVVVLNTYMGDLTGYAGYRSYHTSWTGLNAWQNIGYPGVMTGTQRPVFSGGGAISSTESHSVGGRTGYVLGTFIDTEGGHSGGPVWGWWSGESFPRVVGDMSAESATPAYNESGDNEAGGGSALSYLMTYARANYP